MSLMDILKSYADRPTDTDQDFDEVSRQIPAGTLGSGLADAFRSDRTPDFASMAASLFGGSNPQQRAGLLGQLIQSVGPALLSTLGGGALGRLLKGQGSSSASTSATAEVDPVDAAQSVPMRSVRSRPPPRSRTRASSIGSGLLRAASRGGEGAGRRGPAIALGQIAKRMNR